MCFKLGNDNILPSAEILIKLAKFFNVSTDYLLELDSDNVIDVTGLTNSEITHIKLLGRTKKTYLEGRSIKLCFR